MSTVKLAVVYYSATGTVDAMAHRAAQAGEKAGAEVRLRRVAREAHLRFIGNGHAAALGQRGPGRIRAVDHGRAGRDSGVV